MPRLALKDLGQCSPVELASQHHLQPIKGDIEQLLQHDKLAKPSRFTAEALTIFLPKSSLLDFFLSIGHAARISLRGKGVLKLTKAHRNGGEEPALLSEPT